MKMKYLVCLLWLGFYLLTSGCTPRPKVEPLVEAHPPIKSQNGMVVAAHPLAAQAGVDVLKDGGNAVDAAIATMLALNVVEPHASGLGGGGFAVTFMDNEANVVMYRDRAPRGLDTSYYNSPMDILTEELDILLTAEAMNKILSSAQDIDSTVFETDEGKIKLETVVSELREAKLRETASNRRSYSGTAVCTPGAPAGWQMMFDKWATMPLERLARDAIRYAEEGFVVDPTLSGQIKGNLNKILADSILSEVFLVDGLFPYEIGDTLRQSDLAKTLQKLSSSRLTEFYYGEFARAIELASKADGGFMTSQDLVDFDAMLFEPVSYQFENKGDSYTLLTSPPPSSGGTTVIAALQVLESINLSKYKRNSPQLINMIANSTLQAQLDAEARIADPDFIDDFFWQELISKEYADEVAKSISPKAKAVRRSSAVKISTENKGNTTHLVVIDQWGNAVSITQSINYFFGSGRIAPGTGVILNNHIADFSSGTDTLNALGAGKIPRSNMSPIIVLKSGTPYLVLGTPGGSRIPSATVQILMNVINFDMDIASAIDYPRIFRSNSFLDMENRYPVKSIMNLKKLDYVIRLAGAYNNYFGGAHGILVDGEGVKTGAADKRRGGAAVGY